MFRKPWAFAFLSLAVVAGCGKAADPTTPTSSTTPEASTAAGAGKAAAAPAPKLQKLKIEDVKVGKGEAAAQGDKIWVLYTGRIKDANGKIFDSTDQHDGKAFAVAIGAAQVIAGWEQGLPGMKVGGERNLYIPYSLAYGDAGNSTIPPKTDLFFNVKAVALVKKGEEGVIDAAEVKKGSGPAAKAGDKVTISYVGKLPGGGVFDESKPGKDVTFTLAKRDQYGNSEVLKGIDEGVKGMRVGGVRILTIPPQLGMPSGNEKIPFDSVLIITVNLKKIG